MAEDFFYDLVFEGNPFDEEKVLPISLSEYREWNTISPEDHILYPVRHLGFHSSDALRYGEGSILEDISDSFLKKVPSKSLVVVGYTSDFGASSNVEGNFYFLGTGDIKGKRESFRFEQGTAIVPKRKD